METELKKQIGISVLKLIALSEEAEEKGMSLNSIKNAEKNLEGLLGLLEKAKKKL